MSVKENLEKVRDNVWELPSSYKKEMRVPGRLYLDDESVKNIEEGALEQVANVACMPGIQGASIAMPDIHFGYGFSIGGVGAFNYNNGVVSPGGVGFDINCGLKTAYRDVYPLYLKSISDSEIIAKFKKDIPMETLTGNQKWQLWCAEQFLNLL